MSTSEILTIVFGSLASISLIISALSTQRPRLLLFSIICSMFAIVQFMFAGAIIAAGISSVSIIRNSLLLLAVKKGGRFRWLEHWGVMVFFMLASSAVWFFLMDWEKIEAISFIPLISAILGTVAVFFRNLIYTKSIFLAVGALWFTYNLSYGAYGALVGEAVTFVSNTVALVVLIKSSIAGKEPIDPTTEVIRTITTAIPTAVTSTVTAVLPVISTSTEKIQKIRKSMNGGTPAVETGEFRFRDE